MEKPDFRERERIGKWLYTDWEHAWDHSTGEIPYEHLEEIWKLVVQFSYLINPLEAAKALCIAYHMKRCEGAE